MKSKTVTCGHITVQRDPRGDLTIHARGDGFANIQAADVDDLFAALLEMTRSSGEEDA